MAMRTTDFMLQLAKKLMEERGIAESTATQYLQTLHKLNGGEGFKNLAWTKKFDDVQAVIDTYAPSTQGNQYMVLASVLSPFSTKAAYKSAYNHWRDKMMDARKVDAEKPAHEKSDRQEDSWLSWDEVSKKKSALREDITPFLSHKLITASQFDKLLQYLIVSLYTDIPPRRNQDFLDMYVVKKWNKDMDASKNYYDLSTHRFIFNKYKTAKAYGQQILDVPNTEEAPLQRTLADYLKHHPLAKSKQKEFKLLVKADGSAMSTVNAITRYLNRVFGKKVGSSMLRHSYLSSKYGDTSKEMEEDAREMGHSTDMQRDYIKYET
jgi:integrase